ncbi:hypothetical protein AGMMS49992_20970 [Clostridia bacterium]|nr:hypothetical protein AGMMS49992_20970 [Clostridia bacterium]
MKIGIYCHSQYSYISTFIEKSKATIIANDSVRSKYTESSAQFILTAVLVSFKDRNTTKLQGDNE